MPEITETLHDRLLLTLQQQFLAFDEATEEIVGQEMLSGLAESMHVREMIEAKLEMLGELLDLPRLRVEQAMAAIKDHYTSSSQDAPEGLQEYYQQLVAWFTSPHPHTLLDVSLPILSQ